MSEYIYAFEPIDYGDIIVIHPQSMMVKREEIVRCRDCKYYRESQWVIATDVPDVCTFFSSGVKVEPNGFCKWGEKKLLTEETINVFKEVEQ